MQWTPPPSPRDVLDRPYTGGEGGGTPPGHPPPPPPLLPFQCLRLTAKILLRRLRCQEDTLTKFWRAFGGDHRGTPGGGGSPTAALGPRMSTCGVTALTAARNNLPPVHSCAQSSLWLAHHWGGGCIRRGGGEGEWARGLTHPETWGGRWWTTAERRCMGSEPPANAEGSCLPPCGPDTAQ